MRYSIVSLVQAPRKNKQLNRILWDLWLLPFLLGHRSLLCTVKGPPRFGPFILADW